MEIKNYQDFLILKPNDKKDFVIKNYKEIKNWKNEEQLKIRDEVVRWLEKYTYNTKNTIDRLVKENKRMWDQNNEKIKKFKKKYEKFNQIKIELNQ